MSTPKSNVLINGIQVPDSVEAGFLAYNADLRLNPTTDQVSYFNENKSLIETSLYTDGPSTFTPAKSYNVCYILPGFNFLDNGVNKLAKPSGTLEQNTTGTSSNIYNYKLKFVSQGDNLQYEWDLIGIFSLSSTGPTLVNITTGKDSSTSQLNLTSGLFTINNLKIVMNGVDHFITTGTNLILSYYDPTSQLAQPFRWLY